MTRPRRARLPPPHRRDCCAPQRDWSIGAADRLPTWRCAPVSPVMAESSLAGRSARLCRRVQARAGLASLGGLVAYAADTAGLGLSAAPHAQPAFPAGWRCTVAAALMRPPRCSMPRRPLMCCLAGALLRTRRVARRVRVHIIVRAIVAVLCCLDAFRIVRPIALADACYWSVAQPLR